MNKKSLFFVLMATLINSIGQLFFKIASFDFTLNPLDWITNVALILALGLYFVSAILIITALKYEELSLVYPIIATGFVWVALLSSFLFGEVLSISKIFGISLIVFGVFVLNNTFSTNLKRG